MLTGTQIRPLPPSPLPTTDRLQILLVSDNHKKGLRLIIVDAHGQKSLGVEIHLGRLLGEQGHVFPWFNAQDYTVFPRLMWGTVFLIGHCSVPIRLTTNYSREFTNHAHQLICNNSKRLSELRKSKLSNHDRTGKKMLRTMKKYYPKQIARQGKWTELLIKYEGIAKD